MDNYPHILYPKEEMLTRFDAADPLYLSYNTWVIKERLSAKELLTLSILVRSSKRDLKWRISETLYSDIVEGKFLILYFSVSSIFISTIFRDPGEYIVRYEDVIKWLTFNK